MRLPSVALLLPALLAACGPDDARPESADPTSSVPGSEGPAASAPPVPRGIAGHDTTPHTHAAGHGGEVKTVGELHVEGRFMRSGLMVWVNDADQQPVDLASVTGAAVVKGPAGVTTVLLAPMGDHLHAALTLPEGTAADAVVTFNVAGTPVRVDFRTSSVGSP